MLPITRPLWRAFFMPCPCGGSSGVLSGLFFGGIICRVSILSSRMGFLEPSRHRRRMIPLLQGAVQSLYRPFSGVASCTTSGILCRPGRCGGPWRHRPRGPGAAIPGPENRRFFAGILKDFFGEFFSRIFHRS